MQSRRRILSALAPAALVLLASAGCGGGDEPASFPVAATVTKTVTVAATTPTTTTVSTTRADPSAPLTLAAAEQALDARGYAPLGERDWRPGQQLKVLLGVSRSADPRAEQAFFFVGDTFIGTDTKDPSAAIEVAAQSDDSVTLSYGLYRPADQVDVPTGGTAEVTYRWDGSSLTPQGPIPAASPAAPLSRR
ncbi:MAG: LppP/LprE family lipoprotein [Conexibacter sp.]